MRVAIILISILCVVILIGVSAMKIIELNSNLTTSVNLTRSLKVQSDSMLKENADYRDKLDKIDREFEDIDKENTLLKQKLVEMQGKQSKVEEIVVKQGTKLTELEKISSYVNEVKNELADKEEKLKKSSSDIVEQKDRIGNLEQQLVALKARNDLLDIDAKKKAEAENSQPMTEEDLKRNLEDAEEKLALANDDNVALLSEVADMHYNLGVVLTKQGMFKNAIGEFEEALRIRQDDADSHYNLAVLYDEKMKDDKNSLVHYKAYLKLRPNAEDAEKVRKWIIDKESIIKVGN